MHPRPRPGPNYGRYGYQLRMPWKAVDIAEAALVKEFPEFQKVIDRV